jgi:hypothetical protein
MPNFTELAVPETIFLCLRSISTVRMRLMCSLMDWRTHKLDARLSAVPDSGRMCLGYPRTQAVLPPAAS